MKRQTILSLLLFILLLTIAAFFDFWWALLDGFLTGPLWNDIKQFSDFIQAVVFAITGVTGVLGFLGWIKKPSQQHGADDRLQQAYKDGLTQSCSSLRLDLIAKPLKERRLHLTLSDIYQDQQVIIHEKRDPEEEQADRGMLKNERKPVTLLQALETTEARHLVIRGPVGSGKTSFVNYLTLCILQSADPQHRSDVPKNLIDLPVARLYLREVGSRVCCQDKSGSALIWQELREQTKQHIHNALKENGETIPTEDAFMLFWDGFRKDLQERGVILLDGLDEVAEDCDNNRRAVLRRAIEDFAENSLRETAWVIVTSRPYAYENEKQKLHGFELLDMEPMQETQVREFIRHWYLAARQANNWDETTASRRAEQLANEIESRPPYLPQLAETPLLLTLIIGLDYADIRLPASRARLYEEAVDLMLQRWNQRLQDFQDGLSEADKEGLAVLERSRDELLEAMQTLAYKTYQEIGVCSERPDQDKPLEFSKDTLLRHLWDAFKQEQNHDNLMYFLEYRSGILIGASRQEHFQFAHKSFHEYLAARKLMQMVDWEDKAEELLHQDMDWWREVFLLLLKKYSDELYGKSIQFINYLVRDIPAQGLSAKEQQLILLLAAAGVELGLLAKEKQDSLYQDVLTKLRTWLQETIQGDALTIQQRAQAGRLLGELGDPRPGVTVRRDHPTLPDIAWLEIPAIKGFMMGTNDEDASEYEKPIHPVDIDNFCISRYPITNAQFKCFIEDRGYKKDYWQCKAAKTWLNSEKSQYDMLVETIPDELARKNYRGWLQADTKRTTPRLWHDHRWNLPNHPVVGVSWFEALAFCAWLSEIEGKSIRLPCEEEWEYAARGTKGLKYAWGNKFDKQLGNTNKTGIARTSAVGLFPQGRAVGQGGEPFGLYDMNGNVWEWTRNRWGNTWGLPLFSYKKWKEYSKDERENREAEEFRVMRGGSWETQLDYVDCTARGWLVPHGRGNRVGFRVVCTT